MLRAIFIMMICMSIFGCSTQSPEQIVTAFFQEMQAGNLEKAVSYVSFDEYNQVNITKEDFIANYEKDFQKGLRLIKFKLLKTIKEDNTTEVFLITKWYDHGEKNQIYSCQLEKKEGLWKITHVSPWFGDVPAPIQDIYKTPQDILNDKF